MAAALQQQVGGGDLDGFVHGLVGEGRQHRAHLLLADDVFGADAMGLQDQHLGALGDGNAGLLGDEGSRLAHGFPGQGAILENDIHHLLALGGWHKVRALTLEGCHHGRPVGLMVDEGLFARADDAVVELAAGDDLAGGLHEIDVPVEDHLDIARADAEGGLSGGVGGLDHGHAAGGHHHVTGLHELLGLLHRRIGQDLHQPLGHIELLQGLVDELDRQPRTQLGFGVGCDDDRVLGLEGEHDLGHGRHHGVRHGRDARHHADGLADLDELGRLVHPEDAHGRLVLQVVPDTPGLAVALGDLVFHHAHAGFLDRQLGQHFGVVIDRLGHGLDDRIHLLLVEVLLEDRLGLPCLGHYRPDFHGLLLLPLRGWLEKGLIDVADLVPSQRHVVVGQQPSLLLHDGVGEGFDLQRLHAVGTQLVLGEELAEQQVQAIVDVRGIGAQGIAQQAVELFDSALRLLGLVALEDRGEELVVGLAMGHMVGPAQGIGERVDRTHARVAEGDARVVAGHQHVLEPFESVLGAFRGDALEHVQDQIDGGLGEEPGVGIGLRRHVGFHGVDEGIDGAIDIEVEWQALEQLGNEHGMVGQDRVIRQAHLRALGGDLGDGEVGDFAAGAAGGGKDDQLLGLDDGDAPLEGGHHILETLQDEELGNVDHRAAAHRHHPVEGEALHVLEDAVHHHVRRLSSSVLLLHHHMARQVQPLHEGFVQEGVGDDQVPLGELEGLGEGREGVEAAQAGFQGEELHVRLRRRCGRGRSGVRTPSPGPPGSPDGRWR